MGAHVYHPIKVGGTQFGALRAGHRLTDLPIPDPKTVVTATKTQIPASFVWIPASVVVCRAVTNKSVHDFAMLDIRPKTAEHHFPRALRGQSSKDKVFQMPNPTLKNLKPGDHRKMAGIDEGQFWHRAQIGYK